MTRMFRRAVLLGLVLTAATALPARGAEPAALARARARYNAGDFDAAIAAAMEARQVPQSADAAAVVMARAYVERYRKMPSDADLAAAREALIGVRAPALSARDRVDLLIGTGQVLFLGETFGAAAEIFETALGQASVLSAADRDALLEWWATALDREARGLSADRRSVLFRRLEDRMDLELALNPASPVANYWLPAAARGAGNLERAWSAAVAGWVRATLAPAAAARLRSDLDKLVLDGLVPDRVRTRPGREQASAASALRAEWDAIKQQWP